MTKEKFTISGDVVLEECSGRELQAMDNELVAQAVPWISGWFKLPDGNLHVQKFVVLNTGLPSYRLAGKAVDFWSREILGVEQTDANEISPVLGKRLLIPSVLQTVQAI